MVALALALLGCDAPAPTDATRTAPTPSEAAPTLAPPPVAPSVRPAFDPARCVEPLPGLSWTPLGEGSGGLKHAAATVPDLDGDGAAERFVVRQDAGSGEATMTLTLEPTTGAPIVLETTLSYVVMRHEIPVPAVLRGPDRAAWRAPFEQELLRLRCPEPDPSHAWLVDPSPRWFAGRPVLPFLHGTYDPVAETWSLYSGHTHTMDPPAVGTWPVEDEARGSQRLLRTQHGVALYDGARDAHRWLWVAAQGPRKLRFPTVALAGFDGDAVVVERHAVDATPEPLRIPLAP